jgi:hypothetical protein
MMQLEKDNGEQSQQMVGPPMIAGSVILLKPADAVLKSLKYSWAV